MSKTRSAMIVTALFPPVAAVGVHRTVGLCAHLAERGWPTTVITARPSKESSLDEGLLNGVPQTVRVVWTAAPDLSAILIRLVKGRKTSRPASAADSSSSNVRRGEKNSSRLKRAFKTAVDWLSRWLRVPDGMAGWIVPAVWAGLREGLRRRPDVIFSSAPQWSGHVVATILSRVLCVPHVADFRDPWCGTETKKVPYRSHRMANRLMERLVIGRAHTVTCAWDGIRRHLTKQYPRKASKITTVLNGFDMEIIDRASPVQLESRAKVFIHAGSFYSRRSPIPLLEGLELLTSNGGMASDQAVFAFVGPTHYNGRPLVDLVHAHSVDTIVRVMPPVPQAEMISLLKGADAAILVEHNRGESLSSVPGKAYDYIGLGKPVLAVGAGNEACELLKKGGCRVWSVSTGDPAQIAGAVKDMVEYLNGNESQELVPNNARSQFTRKLMASRLASVLLSAIAND